MQTRRRTTGRTLAWVVALGACGPMAEPSRQPPGHLEYDWRTVRVYRDGARVEHVPVPEELGLEPGDPALDVYAKCFYLNEEGLRTIEETIASLDPSAEYPERECPNAPIDAYTRDLLYLEGFDHSPFVCPMWACFCNEELAPIPGVHGTVLMNLDGITPKDDEGNEYWYLDTTRGCTPGAWDGGE